VFIKQEYKKKPPSSSRAWALAGIISLIFHILILYKLLPELKKDYEKVADNLEVDIIFKPVVMSLSPDNKKPEKARYYADKNQSTKQERKSRHTSTNANLFSKKALPASKAPKINDFLATKALDPLGLNKALPKAEPFGDHVPDVATSDQTELNTWTWRHAPFFNRIKAQIGHVWAPHEQIARYDPQGLLLGHEDRVTVMRVSINPKGNLISLVLAHSSGVAYLDEEAERALQKAAPFPFPPKDLFAHSEDFTFQFAFHLQLNRGIKFDFEWQPAH
jgi:protein TonB